MFCGKPGPHGKTQINRNGIIIKTELSNKKFKSLANRVIINTVSMCSLGAEGQQDQLGKRASPYRRLKQEDQQEFEASLGYMVNSTWATQQDPVTKTKQDWRDCSVVKTICCS